MPLFKFNPQTVLYEKTITVNVVFDDASSGGVVYSDVLTESIAFDDTLVAPAELPDSLTSNVVFDDPVAGGFVYEKTITVNVVFDDATAIVEGTIYEDTLVDAVVFHVEPISWFAFLLADDITFNDVLASWFAVAVSENVTFTATMEKSLVVQPHELISSVYFHADVVASTDTMFLTDGVRFYSAMGGGRSQEYEEFLSDRVAFNNILIPGNHIYELTLFDKAAFYDLFLPLEYTITWRCRTRTPGCGYGGVEYGYEKGYGEGIVLDVASIKIEVYSTDNQSGVRALKRTVIISIADPSDPDADASWTYTEAMNRQDHDGTIRGHKIGFKIVQVGVDGKESTM